MTPEERQLINGLFERMRSFGTPEKDREAEALINRSVRDVPDATYMLVQSVLVQEQALQAANARVEELEERLQGLQGDGRSRAAQGSGSFLGGLFGSGQQQQARPSSVPAIGSKAPGSSGASSAWSQGRAQDAPPQAPAASGGFMRSALATAAGVAGGMLLADSIRNMMGGAQASPSPAGADKASGGETQQAADRSGGEPPGSHDVTDASYEGGDFGGDIDI